MAVIEYARRPMLRERAKRLWWRCILVGLWLPPAHADAQERRSFALTTSDGVTIPAIELTAEGAVGPFVLLFHQGGASGWAEYSPIAPRLSGMGYRVLIIDQRRGGDLFGGTNPVAAAFDADTTPYCDAMPEIEAALDYARQADPRRKSILWGSSYSAALVIQLAARRPGDVAGVLAFSPASGDAMSGCQPEPWAEALGPPLLVVRPSSEMEHEWIAQQLSLFGRLGHRTFVANPGRHGSSSLVEERVGEDIGASWREVLDFLASLESHPGPG